VTLPDTWDPIHPDTLNGPDLDLVLALFRDIDWRDQAVVERRVADLRTLDDASRP